MKFASLFAGVGGFDLAFERAGMECVAQVEIDARCREVLATHWPDVPRFEDVHEVSGKDIGTADLLCGGFPCQDYSVAGKRGGLAGDRGALWWQFHRLIDVCRPEWVVGENVPGLLSSNDGRDFGAIVGSLVGLGYGVVWRVLDAQYFGVAQRRRRVFIVGHFGGIPRPEILAFAEGCAGDPAPSRQPGEGVAPSLANRAKGGGGLGTDVELDGELIAATIETRPTSDRWRVEDNHLIPSTVGALRTRDWKGPPIDVAEPSLIAFDWTQGGQPLDDMSPTLRVGSGLGIPSSPAIAFAQNTRDEVRDLHNLAGALAAQPGMKQTTYLAVQGASQQDQFVRPDGVVPTLAHASNTHAGHHEPKLWQGASVRRLTPLECERLQGFPDNWTASQSDTQRYRQMGNAVAVPVAEWIGQRLAAA